MIFNGVCRRRGGFIIILFGGQAREALTSHESENEQSEVGGEVAECGTTHIKAGYNYLRTEGISKVSKTLKKKKKRSLVISTRR